MELEWHRVNEEPDIWWCSICGKNIWKLNPQFPEDLICDECNKIINTYEDQKLNA
jgi:hypothetical protein